MPKQPQPQPCLSAYPNIAEWVTGHGWVEIGQDDFSRSQVRVLDIGGMIWESTGSYDKVDAALRAADDAIAAWFEENG